MQKSYKSFDAAWRAADRLYGKSWECSYLISGSRGAFYITRRVDSFPH